MRDPDVVFEDFEWLLDQGVHALSACRQVGYRNVNSLTRMYYRENRSVPPALLIEAGWQKSHQAAHGA